MHSARGRFMDQFKRTLRFGAAVISWAVVARLGASGAFRPLEDWFRRPDTQSFLIYLETGRKVRFSPSLEENTNPVTLPPIPTETAVPETAPPETEPPPALPVFSAQDTVLTEVKYSCSLRPDLETLMGKPLSWDLTDREPRVLILHTHATESYTRRGEDYKESSAYRTLDEGYNMISVGARVAELLQEEGIGVIHDRQLHDYPSYNGSYNHARKSIQAILEENPSICLVLDLHRDASGDLKNQFRPVAEVEGEDTAQIMLVMGTNAAGLNHPHWQDNLSLGLKLQAQLERQAPGITRPISLRSQRFNQDLTKGSLLIEMGAAGNSHAEALRAAEQLAKAIIALSRGTQSAAE
jgi:stage II sporulation protein P